MLPLIQFAFLLVFPALVIFAAVRDATSYLIPNWISLAILATFFPAALALGMSPAQIGVSTLVGVGVTAIVMGMFAVGWIGGGDAKIFAASAFWMGLSGLYPFVTITALAGGALAIMLLLMRSAWLRPITTGMGGWFGRLATPAEKVPYAVAIACGALTAFPHTLIVRQFPGLS